MYLLHDFANCSLTGNDASQVRRFLFDAGVPETCGSCYNLRFLRLQHGFSASHLPETDTFMALCAFQIIIKSLSANFQSFAVKTSFPAFF